MRSHSGDDDARDNLHDPTLRDRAEGRTKRENRSKSVGATAPADHRGGRKD